MHVSTRRNGHEALIVDPNGDGRRRTHCDRDVAWVDPQIDAPSHLERHRDGVVVLGELVDEVVGIDDGGEGVNPGRVGRVPVEGDFILLLDREIGHPLLPDHRPEPGGPVVQPNDRLARAGERSADVPDDGLELDAVAGADDLLGDREQGWDEGQIRLPVSDRALREPVHHL